MKQKIRVLSVFGTRPEVIKMAPVVHALQACDVVESFVCTTSQHRHMQDQMMKLFNIKADFDLNVMKPGQSINYVASRVIERLDQLLNDHAFDLVLVHGDTTTSFAAAYAAFNNGVKVGHVEAGLRTYDLSAPFPEEANRQLTGCIATYHFAPTEQSKKYLLNEGVQKDKIIVTGNTVIDALFYIKEQIANDNISVILDQKVKSLISEAVPYVLITGHRRESFGGGFLNICEAIKALAEKYPTYHFVYPVHLNPQVQKPVLKILSNLSNVHLIDPVDYAPFVYLMMHAKLVLTDSGGVQEEAPSLGKPVLVMREVTERPEGIDAGTAQLVGNDKQTIVAAVSALIDDEMHYQDMANAVNPYGDGKAAERIVGFIQQVFAVSP